MCEKSIKAPSFIVILAFFQRLA
jgi:hypothetical protein